MSKVHDLINHERKKRGISTVYWSREMARLAQSQAQFCVKKGHMIHSKRFAFQGGENLAQGGGDFTPRAIVDCWLSSKAGHREYLLSPRVTKAGVGIAKSKGKTFVAWAFSDASPSFPDCPYYKQQTKRKKPSQKSVNKHNVLASKKFKYNRKQIAPKLKLAGGIVGLVFSILSVALLIGDVLGGAIGRIWQSTILPVVSSHEVILWAIIGALALIGSILSKRKTKLGGVILISCSLALIPTLDAANWGLFGLPYLIAGVLLLVSLRFAE